MAYVRPDSYISNDQKIIIYNAIHRAHVTASETLFTLKHVTDALPMDKADGPYDVPDDDPTISELTFHAMIGMKKDDQEITDLGEELGTDLKLFVWLEELEGAGLGTTSGELDLLTKDTLVYEGEEYKILSVKPTMPFFGKKWEPGTVPNPTWDRNALAAKIVAQRLERQ